MMMYSLSTTSWRPERGRVQATTFVKTHESMYRVRFGPVCQGYCDYRSSIGGGLRLQQRCGSQSRKMLEKDGLSARNPSPSAAADVVGSWEKGEGDIDKEKEKEKGGKDGMEKGGKDDGLLSSLETASEGTEVAKDMSQVTPDSLKGPVVKLLFDQLTKARDEIQCEKDRQRALAPFRVAAPKRGIIGNSRYAQSLRKQVSMASKDMNRGTVFILGEPGLEKSNIGVLIHFGSPFSKAPVVRLDCARLDDDASELIGRYAKRGLLSWVPPDGTIILDNVHKAPPSVLPFLQKTVATSSYSASIDTDDEEHLLFLNDLDVEESLMESLSEMYSNQEEEEEDCVDSLPQWCTFPRIIMTAEEHVPSLEALASQTIKVPPLRVHPQDIRDYARYFLRQLTREQGLSPLQLTPEAMKRLEVGTYPNNIAELEGAISNAVSQAVKRNESIKYVPGTDATENELFAHRNDFREGDTRMITEDDLWLNTSPKDRLRVVNLLKIVPGLKDFLRSEWWPKKLNHGFTKYAFAAVVAILFLGPQDREHNFALNAFWCFWWPLGLISYPLLGRIWCSICPFMIYGDIVQAWRKSQGAKLMKWPKEEMERWGGWFLFVMFAGILVWEEVWDLPQHAALSSWLLLLITAGAVIGSYFFERRIWCRHLCPIGGMNGMFAKLSMTELRARQGVCSAECNTYSCCKGGPAMHLGGMETEGCRANSHPAQLTDNRNCFLCMECLKACPHDSIEFRLRMPGAGIWSGEHKPLVPEVALMFLLLGALPLHYLPQLLNDVSYADPGAILEHKIPHIAASLVVLGVPGLASWGLDAGWRGLAALLSRPSSPALAIPSPSASTSQALQVLNASAASYAAQMEGAAVVPPAQPFYKLAYGYLPLVWAGTLAYYLPFLLLEGGHILPAAFETFHLSPPDWIPSLETNTEVVKFLQGSSLITGAGLSLGLLRRISAQPWKVVAPQYAFILLCTAELWHLFLY